MSAFGPPIWGEGKGAPEHKGKLHQSTSVKMIGQAKKKGYLKYRMKQDDSSCVNMSDQKLGGGIGQTGSAK